MSRWANAVRPEVRMTLLGMRLRVAQFLEQVKTTKQRVLLLDYDGTLAPFSADRESALPYQGIRELLNFLMRVCRTRVVLVSGRAVMDLLPVLGDHLQPEIWGSHGVERFDCDGTYECAALNNGIELLLETAITWMEKEGFAEFLELKAGSVALHWRGQSHGVVREAQLAVARVWRPLTDATGLQLLKFDEGIELRVAHPNRGDVVSAILAEATEATAVAYLGHDDTDEEAFRALRGKGLSALVRPHFRPTEAEVWLKPPSELMAFLNAWMSAAHDSK